jgi:hypothetical protein
MKSILKFVRCLLFIIPISIINAQNLPDISGNWFSNGDPNAVAVIKQDGNQLMFTYNQGNASGYFTGPNQVFAIEWNALGNIDSDLQTINWNNQVWKRKSHSQVNYPDISGNWYVGGDAANVCKIIQDGFNLNFDLGGNHSTGYYYEGNKIYAKEWNAYGEVLADNKSINWNDQIWSRSTRTQSSEINTTNKYCRFELSSFYYASQLLGAVWGRSATEPAMPTLEAISAMEAHISTAIRVYSSNEYFNFDKCLRYDLSKLKRLYGNLRGMSSAQIRKEIEDIIKELQLAIKNTTFQCDNNVHPYAIYIGGIHLGAAQAWASAQQCRPAPMSPVIASTIAAHLGEADKALRPYAPCLQGQRSNGAMVPAFDFNTFAMVPLASPNSIAAHTFISGIETQLLWAIALSPCCCSCSAKQETGTDSACDSGCQSYCKQKGYQNGTYNGRAPCMLGVVQEGGCDCH